MKTTREHLHPGSHRRNGRIHVNMYVPAFLLTVFCLGLPAPQVLAQFTATWLDIGDFQDAYSQVGAFYRPSTSQEANTWSYPAIRFRSSHYEMGAFFIGVRNWTSPDGEQFPYYTSRIGPRDPGTDFASAIQDKLISKWEDTQITVDGVASFDKVAVVSEVDPDLPADRAIEVIWNMDVGMTGHQRAYAYSNQFHDEYHLVEYTFTNTGNVDDDEDIELLSQTLEDVYFFFLHDWRGSEQAARVGDGGQQWGKYNMIDVVGDGHSTYPVDFTAYYAWKGWEPGFDQWNNLGGPLLEQCCGAAQGDSIGRLSGGYFDGEMVIYAPNSVDDPTYDPLVQPHTISFMDTDEKLASSGAAHREYYEDGILSRERQTRTPEIPPSRSWPHYADRIEPSGEFWNPRNDPSSGRQGGHAQTVAFGPYQMAPGDAVRIILARGVGGLDFDAQLKIGRAYKLSGANDEFEIAYDANGDGVIDETPYSYHDVFDLGRESLTKNQWVMSGRDSLFKIFYNARDVYRASEDFTRYPIPQPPLPPRTFSVNGLPDHISLSWEPLNGGPNRTGWEVYRTYRYPYWSPSYDLIRSGIENVLPRRIEDELPYTCVAGIRPDCEQPALPPDATSFNDTEVTRGTDYYYYITALGEPQPDDPKGIEGTVGGVPLRSSRYYTQTYQPVNLKRPPFGRTGTIEDARVVPNPVNLGSDQSIRFAKEDEIAFFNIPGECTIKVFTMTGELIVTLHHTDGSGDHKWDLTTASRQLIVSGIYIAVIETPQGERVLRKFTVIR